MKTGKEYIESIRAMKFELYIAAGYKVPKKVFLKSALPMTASGKILKRDLRRQFAGEQSK